MPDFRKGKIYEITGETGKKIYIGSTTQTLSQRKAEHSYSKSKPSRPQFESSELKMPLKIKLIERFPTTSKKSLERREGQHIEYLRKKPKGKKVLNKKTK